MKPFFIFFIGFLFSTTIYSQDIISALKNGNAKELAQYFDNSVEITIGEQNSSTNKIKGEELLRNFFTTAGVKDFQLIHKSGSTSSQYYIGNLTTNSGLYRTTVFLKQKEKNTFIQEIRFEK